MRLFTVRMLFQLLSALISLAVGLLLARWLGPSGRGTLALLVLIPFVAASFASLGFNAAAPFLHRRCGLTLEALTAGVYSLQFWIGIPASIATGILLITLGPGFWFYGFSAQQALIVGFLCFAGLGLLLMRGLFRARSHFDAILTVDAVQVIGPLLVVACFKALGILNVDSALLAYLVAGFLALAVAVPLVRGPGTTLLGPVELKEFVGLVGSYGMRTQFRTLGALFLQRVNFVIVGRMLGMEELGYFAVASSVTEMMARIPDAATWFVGPMSAELADHEADRQTRRFAWIVLGITAFGGLLILLFAYPVVEWVLSDTYRSAVPVLFAMLIGSVALSYARVLEANLVGRGFATPVAAATWIGGALVVSADFVLIPLKGAVGAGIAGSLGCLVTTVAVVFSYRRYRLARREETR